MARVQDKAASDDGVFVVTKITFGEMKEGWKGSGMNANSRVAAFTQHTEMEIISHPPTSPQVNQTGEVRLLSKLLNQKVDTVCCMRSRAGVSGGGEGRH